MHRTQYRAPARVNLIGGQVDYHEGIVVSMAIDREVVVSIAPRDDGRIEARSADLEGIVNIAADGSDDPTRCGTRMGSRDRRGGRARSPTRHHRVLGADLFVSSTIPIGAGLSSSAAFEVAVALALTRPIGHHASRCARSPSWRRRPSTSHWACRAASRIS